MNVTGVAVVILAAGKGTRMKSDLPKVLHTLNGKTMISSVVESASSLFGDKIIVVIGHKAELVKQEVNRNFRVDYALQEQLLGTGDAVRTAVPYLGDGIENVLVLCGDVPLISKETILGFVEHHLNNDNDLTVMGVTVENPTGYGRIICNDAGQFVSICEESDATPEQKIIKTVNAGVYCIKRNFLVCSLEQIGTDNAQKEYYLTDLVSIAFKNGRKAGCFIGQDSFEVMGINTVEELKRAESLIRSRNF